MKQFRLIFLTLILTASVAVADWHTETIDASGTGKYSSIATDASDYPHISYTEHLTKDLRYARWDGTAWQIETAEATDDAGRYTSITLDSNDYPHFSYFDNDNHKDDNEFDFIKYARYESGAAVESVDLFANSRDEGVLLSWSIVGDTPATVSVLRSAFCQREPAC